MANTENKLKALLKDARQALYKDYLAAGGDDESATNQSLKNRGKLIDRIDKVLSGPTPDPESAARKCECPHGCKRECDDQARCPFCWNSGKGCPVLFHGGADPERGEK